MRESRAVAGADATHLMTAMTSAFALEQIGGPLIVSYFVGSDGALDRSLLFACAVLMTAADLLWRRPGCVQ